MFGAGASGALMGASLGPVGMLGGFIFGFAFSGIATKTL